MATQSEGRGGRFKRAWARMAAPAEQIEAEEVRELCAGPGVVPVADVADRSVATVKGALRTVTLRPRAGLPALEAELYDGTGALTLIWLGRRRIAGIESGRVVSATGRCSTQEGHRVMFNPRYELLPQTAAS